MTTARASRYRPPLLDLSSGTARLDLASVGTWLASSDRQREYRRADPCAYCGRAATTWDHIDPRSLDPRRHNGAHNQTRACYECNHAKGSRRLLAFLVTRSVDAFERQASRERTRHRHRQVLLWRHLSRVRAGVTCSLVGGGL